MIARRVGVSKATLYRWRDEFPAGSEVALVGPGVCHNDRRNAEFERGIADRDQGSHFRPRTPASPKNKGRIQPERAWKKDRSSPKTLL